MTTLKRERKKENKKESKKERVQIKEIENNNVIKMLTTITMIVTMTIRKHINDDDDDSDNNTICRINGFLVNWDLRCEMALFCEKYKKSTQLERRKLAELNSCWF